MYEILFLQLIG